MKMNFVYELACSGGKFYIGQTGNIVRRFKEHKEGEGAAWTKLFPAQSIVRLEETSGSDFKEVSWTLDSMNRHGMTNVRGGPFCRTELTYEDTKVIVTLMKSNAFPNKWSPLDCDKHLFDENGELESPASRREKTGSRAGLPWLPTEDTELLDKLQCGENTATVAKLLNRSEGSIIERRKRHIVRLNDEGVSTNTIAEMFFVTNDIITRAIMTQ